jgi:CheY-like chemotaxis protein/HPt (histidine-containing phosphotransfer) domain-containing protein
MDFKTKLAFALVAACLLSMSALGYFTHLWAEDSFLTDSQRQLNVLAESRKVQIDRVFGGWADEFRQVVSRVRASDSISDDPNATEGSSMDGIAGILEDAQAESENLLRLSLIDLAEIPSLAIGRANPQPFDDEREADVEFSGVRIETDHQIGLVFQAWLTRGSVRVGLLEAVFDGHALVPLLGHSPEIGDSGETLLLVPAATGSAGPSAATDDYFILGSSENEATILSSAEAPELISTAMQGQQGTFVGVRDQRGQDSIAATRFLSEAGWGVVVKIDDAEARKRSDQLLADMRTLGISLAAFAILGGTLFGFYLGAPINKLVLDVDRIRHGELGLRLTVKGEDEVAFLAQSLNEFMDQLDRSSDLFRLGELRVLVVCDDGKARELLKVLLQNWNMRPTLADNTASAVSAIERARRADEAPQLVVVDDALPDVEIKRFVDQLRSAASAQLPIILLSSEAEELDPSGLEKTGIGRVLPKPIVASHLMEAILDEMGVSETGYAPTADVFLKKTKPRKILLAEDNPLMQQVMIGFLENWGHQVILAENGRIALEFARNEQFDLIFMDVEMPETNGLDATAAIRAREENGDSRVPIIALTAESLPGDRERCLAAGMDDYISKPADPKALYAMIKRYPARALDAELTETDEAPPDGGTIAAENDDDEILVDWNVARSFTNGDEKLLRDLISIFQTESRDQIEGIRCGIDNDDAELLTRSAHTLKSSALVFGASSLANVALSIELHGRRSEFEEARILLGPLELQTTRFNAVLAREEARSQTGQDTRS